MWRMWLIALAALAIACSAGCGKPSDERIADEIGEMNPAYCIACGFAACEAESGAYAGRSYEWLCSDVRNSDLPILVNGSGEEWCAIAADAALSLHHCEDFQAIPEGKLEVEPAKPRAGARLKASIPATGVGGATVPCQATIDGRRLVGTASYEERPLPLLDSPSWPLEARDVCSFDIPASAKGKTLRGKFVGDPNEDFDDRTETPVVEARFVVRIR